MRSLCCFRWIVLAALCGCPGVAQGETPFSIVSFSLSGSPAGGAIIQSVGDTTNAITNLVMGPGMYVVMAIGAVLALYGWARGNKESLWTGLTLFLLASLLKALFAFL